jgi:hypothetical protein
MCDVVVTGVGNGRIGKVWSRDPRRLDVKSCYETSSHILTVHWKCREEHKHDQAFQVETLRRSSKESSSSSRETGIAKPH